MHYSGAEPYVARGLQILRERIDAADIPPSQLDESLNVATWNIREFGRVPRLDASIYYIAEIINQFDLVALTELRDNLGDLKRVMDLLGSYWDVVFCDFTGDRGGNSERIAYLFDTRMIVFTGLAAEADPPRRKNSATNEYEARFTWWRPPYMASFSAGSFDFVVITAHMRWGKSLDDRVNALAEFAKWVKKRRNDKFATDNDFIVMGDFNVPKNGDRAHKALTGNGRVLIMPEQLIGLRGANLSGKSNYDQILHSPTSVDRFSGRAGVVDFYAQDWATLYPEAGHRPADFRKFTYEMSDHLPLWLQIRTDISDSQLQALAAKAGDHGA